MKRADDLRCCAIALAAVLSTGESLVGQDPEPVLPDIAQLETCRRRLAMEDLAELVEGAVEAELAAEVFLSRRVRAAAALQQQQCE